jgi:hypothetical protein
LQGIDLPFHFLERGALRGDEETPIVAPDVSQKGNPDGCRVVGSAGLDVQLKGSEDVHGLASSWL